MIKKIKAILPLLIMASVACSGAIEYTPRPVPIDPQRVPDLRSIQSIMLANMQPAGSEIDVTVPPFTLKVDLHQYTETVIGVVEAELRKKGVVVSDAATDIVKIAVVDVAIIPRAARFKCDINYVLEMDSIGRFGAEASAENWDFQKAIDAALTETALQVLKDKRFTSPLEGN